MKRQKQQMDQLIPPQKLDFWLKQRRNVLFEGKHGVGKTSIVLNAFERNKLRYISLSGATMDPFIDFVGVPVKVKTKTGEQVIDLLRPKYIQDANPQAIFIDEFNRSHKKVRNAVMELIQFKTINGQPIGKDLRVIWAAINPDDDDLGYDTERLDPAQRDRFHVQIMLPYQCDRQYFTSKYGAKWASAAIEFWNNIPQELKAKCSPRRLDYALQMIKDNGDARDVLPTEANVSALTLALKSGPAQAQLESLLKNAMNDEKEVYKFFGNEINFNRSITTIAKQRKYFPLLEYVPHEKLAASFTKFGKLRRYMLTSVKQKKNNSPFIDLLQELVASNQNNKFARMINKVLPKVKVTTAGKSAKKQVIVHKWPSGPIAKAMANKLMNGKSNLQDLVVVASAAKKASVPVAKVQAKLKNIGRWALKNKFTLKESSGMYHLEVK